ncbi:hypothetical protein POL68_31315 [Stigmatella sp. ncwal1]|uniref:MJ0042 family finger-like domain-containing protein n=1 Tax=Stigmatella ashevillensis TaxID=2995309 RepID=A0ABT5DIN0_9BACT|nr:hypothetical protein [Stigmatella ashevillena]MDC0712993.1 hypothetical protein [Stigmatella ashevillena]
MRFLCDVCERLAPPAAFRVELGVLVMTCARCGKESRARPEEALVVAVTQESESVASVQQRLTPVPALKVVTLRPSDEQVRGAAAMARSEDPFAVPPGFCPKCIAVRRAGAESCAACGLVYANFSPEEQRPSEDLQAAWLSVLGRWDDRDAHDRLLSLAVGRGELAMAGRLYRIRLAQAPEDLYAQRGRDEVVRLASASPVAFAPTSPAGLSSRTQLVVAIIFFLFLLVSALLIFRQFRLTFGRP